MRAYTRVMSLPLQHRPFYTIAYARAYSYVEDSGVFGVYRLTNGAFLYVKCGESCHWMRP
jgi:hypothetical protein